LSRIGPKPATSRTISESKDLKPSPDLVLVDGEVSKKETAVRAVDSALKHFGRIDLLVNNAGILIPKPFTEYTEEDYNRVINTNVASNKICGWQLPSSSN
jgi:NAD(P)-dependent dehydrogenase (short-subunit alcohol dehydrogenase family)